MSQSEGELKRNAGLTNTDRNSTKREQKKQRQRQQRQIQTNSHCFGNNMAQQGNSHPHPPKGWDRLVNPVQDLGRSLLNFLVGGSSTTATLTSESQQNAAHKLDNSIVHSMCVDGQKEEKTNIRDTSYSFDATAPRSTPIILKRTQQTINSGIDNSVDDGQILNNSRLVSTNKASSLRFCSTVQVNSHVSPNLFVKAIGPWQLKYLLLGQT